MNNLRIRLLCGAVSVGYGATLVYGAVNAPAVMLAAMFAPVFIGIGAMVADSFK
jgi:hypothetical protein